MLNFTQHERSLLSMPALQCDICSSDIERYYDAQSAVVNCNKRLFSMAAGGASNQNVIGTGRIVILRNTVSILCSSRNRLTDEPGLVSTFIPFTLQSC